MASRELTAMVRAAAITKIMMRGTFATAHPNRIRCSTAKCRAAIRSAIPAVERGRSIWAAPMKYIADGTPLVLAGKEYGTGSRQRLGGQGCAVAGRARRHCRELLSASTVGNLVGIVSCCPVHGRRERQEPWV